MKTFLQTKQRTRSIESRTPSVQMAQAERQKYQTMDSNFCSVYKFATVKILYLYVIILVLLLCKTEIILLSIQKRIQKQIQDTYSVTYRTFRHV